MCPPRFAWPSRAPTRSAPTVIEAASGGVHPPGRSSILVVSTSEGNCAPLRDSGARKVLGVDDERRISDVEVSDSYPISFSIVRRYLRTLGVLARNWMWDRFRVCEARRRVRGQRRRRLRARLLRGLALRGGSIRSGRRCVQRPPHLAGCAQRPFGGSASRWVALGGFEWNLTREQQVPGTECPSSFSII